MVTRKNNKAPMPHVPYDIMVGVLLRLPVKSLLRFRCVCKSWRSLISDPQFVKNHHNLAISDVNVGGRRVLLPSFPLLQSIDYEEAQFDGDNVSTVLDYPNNYSRVSFSKSCNGLVCMVVNMNDIILCNPCTRDIRVLPKPSCYCSRTNHFNNIRAYGFAYDSSIDDYKVGITSRPVWFELNIFGKFQVEVFSLRTNSWRKICDNASGSHSEILPANTFFYSFGRGTGGTFVNGALHWIGCSGTITNRKIVPFKLATERFLELLPLPPIQDDDYIPENYQLNVSGEGLLAVHCGYMFAEHEIWVMEDYGVNASWTKLFSIRNKLGFEYFNLWSVCFSKNGEVLVDVDGCCLRMYNPETRNFRDLHVQDKWLRHVTTEYDEMITYVESLVSPNG